MILELDLSVAGAGRHVPAGTDRRDLGVGGVDLHVADHVLDAHRSVAGAGADRAPETLHADLPVGGGHLDLELAGNVQLQVDAAAPVPAAGDLDVETHVAGGVLGTSVIL